jgi:Flp pilus assembly protein TadD
MRIPARVWVAIGASLALSGCATYTPIRTHFNKGVRLYNEKNYPGAAREYRLALEEDPCDWRARFNLAMSLEEMDRKEQARAEYEWILGQRPDDLRTSINLAGMDIEAGNRDLGYARLEALIVRYPTMAMPKVALATQYLREDRLDEAETLARDALKIDDSDIEANYILGEILAKKARTMEAGTLEREETVREARLHLATALKNDPNDVASILALGRLERAEGKTDLAHSYYRRVVLHRRRNEEAHQALAEMSEEAGDLEDAVQHLLEIRAIGGPGAAAVAARLTRLYAELLRQEEQRLTSSRPASEPQ